MSLKNLALDVESIALALSEEGGYEYYHINDELRELAKNVSDMQAENAKLRELVQHLYEYRQLYFKTGIYPTDHGVTERRMRELEVEVKS